MFRLSRVASPRGTFLAFALVAAACVAFGAVAQANLSGTPAFAASERATIAASATDAPLRDC